MASAFGGPYGGRLEGSTDAMSDSSFFGGFNRHGRAGSTSSSSSVGSGISPFHTFRDIGSPPTPPTQSPTSSCYPHGGRIAEEPASYAPPTTQATSPPRRSRNDIFSQSWKVAAPHVRPVASTSAASPPAKAAPTPELASVLRRKESKDSGFSFISSGSSVPASPTSIIGTTPHRGIVNGATWSPASSQDTPPQLHPAFSFESNTPSPTQIPPLKDRASPIIPSSSVLLRLHPHPRYLLGEGGHASVYLASFKASDPQSTAIAGGRWRLCAAKRPHADREDNAANLREAAILQRLGAFTGLRGSDPARKDHCPWIVNLHAVKDERDETELARTPLAGQASLGFGRPPRFRDGPLQEEPTPVPASNPHFRSFSASEALASAVSDDGRLRVATAIPSLSVIASFPLRPQTSTIDAIAGDHPPVSGHTPGVDRLQPSHMDYFPDAPPPTTRQSLPNPSVSSRGTSLATLTGLGATLASSSRTTTTTTTTDEAFDPPRLVLLLEYCPGGTLFDFVRTSPERVGRGRWSGWAKQLAAAVAWCRKSGVVIADLKPQNVLLAEDLTLRLADFNRSVLLSPNSPLPTDPLGIGTSAYSPPELVRCAPSPFGYPADVFSLGVTLCVALTGREPFQAVRSPVERMMWVSRGGYWEYEERLRYGGGSQPPSRAGSMRKASRAPSTTGTPIKHHQSIRERERERSISISSPATTSPIETGLLNERLLDVSAARGAAKIGQRAIEGLLRDGDDQDEDLDMFGGVPSPLHSRTGGDISRRSSVRSTTSSRGSSFPDLKPANPPWPDDPDTAPDDADVPLTARYSDGTPLQWYLDGRHVVSEGTRWLLRKMCESDAANRPDIDEILQTLDILYPGAVV